MGKGERGKRLKLGKKRARLDEPAGHCKEAKLFQLCCLEAVTDSDITGESLTIFVTVDVFFFRVEHVIGE